MHEFLEKPAHYYTLQLNVHSKHEQEDSEEEKNLWTKQKEIS